MEFDSPRAANDGNSEDFFSSYFLDGPHQYEHVVAEIRHVKRLGACIVCGDDHNEAFPGVMRAVAEELARACA